MVSSGGGWRGLLENNGGGRKMKSRYRTGEARVFKVGKNFTLEDNGSRQESRIRIASRQARIPC